jgi:hypothetical protein
MFMDPKILDIIICFSNIIINIINKIINKFLCNFFIKIKSEPAA